MSKRALGISIALVVIATVIGVILTRPSASKPDAPPSLIATASPTPSPLPSHDAKDAAEDHDAAIAPFVERYPVVNKLPYGNKYWYLQFDGSIKDDRVPLVATVYLLTNDVEEEKIAQSKVYIEQWLQSIGQLPETYTLRFRTERYDTY